MSKPGSQENSDDQPPAFAVNLSVKDVLMLVPPVLAVMFAATPFTSLLESLELPWLATQGLALLAGGAIAGGWAVVYLRYLRHRKSGSSKSGASQGRSALEDD